MIEDKDSELLEYLKMGYSFHHSWHGQYERNGYVEYILYFHDDEVLKWRSDMGICHDMVAIIKKHISDKRNRKLNQLGI
jgi:hypothetical protein